MVKLKIPFHLQCSGSFDLVPVIVRDSLGTEIWFLFFYIAVDY